MTQLLWSHTSNALDLCPMLQHVAMQGGQRSGSQSPSPCARTPTNSAHSTHFSAARPSGQAICDAAATAALEGGPLYCPHRPDLVLEYPPRFLHTAESERSSCRPVDLLKPLLQTPQ